MRYGMIIDLNKCYGCHACAVACKQKNSTPPNVFWSRVYTTETGTYPNARREFKPSMCMHCADAPCVNECPSGASYKTEDGAVLIKQNQCIACLRCMAACPYEARFFDFYKPESYFPGQEVNKYEAATVGKLKSGAVSKCNLCSDRLSEGGIPTCVQTCPTVSRTFGDLDSKEMQDIIIKYGGYQERSELGTNPSIYYLPKR